LVFSKKNVIKLRGYLPSLAFCLIVGLLEKPSTNLTTNSTVECSSLARKWRKHTIFSCFSDEWEKMEKIKAKH
jgi:hypothetical protein